MSLYNTIKTWFDANINTNGVKGITGAINNSAFVNYILQYMPSLAYDDTRPYKTDQLSFRNVGNVYAIYKANTDMVAGVFNSANWDVIIAVETVTQSITSSGNQDINHNLGKSPALVLAETSTGKSLELQIEARDNTKITINSLTAFNNAKIHLLTWGN